MPDFSPRTKAFAACGLIFILSFLFLAFYQFRTDWLPDTDGYYHMKVAYLLRTQGFMRQFKWAHLSLWREHYSDKEFLYHIYLIPFSLMKNMVLGAKLATVLMGTIVFTSFYAILRLNRVRYAWLWWLLLTMAGGYFLYRVNVPRPQGLSIVYVLWAIHFLINRKRIPLAILCFLYTYSYTAYHLPFIFACIIYFYQLIFEKENDWKTPLTVLASTLGGMLLSPFFPDNFRMFYLQNFYILLRGTDAAGTLHMGGEFWPMDTRAAISVNTAVILPFLLAFFTALYAPLKRGKELRSIFLIAVALAVLTCSSKRFAEYSVPVTLLFCGFFFSPYLEMLDWKKLSMLQKAGIGVLSAGLLTGLSINSFNNTVGEFDGVTEPGMKQAALWLKQHTKENELVYTGDWDDAPELLFFNHKDRYLVILDPNFMYCWKPEIWKRWDDLSNGRLDQQTFDVLKNEFHVRYGVATNDFSSLRQLIVNDGKRMRIALQTPSAYVFEVDTLGNGFK